MSEESPKPRSVLPALLAMSLFFNAVFFIHFVHLRKSLDPEADAGAVAAAEPDDQAGESDAIEVIEAAPARQVAHAMVPRMPEPFVAPAASHADAPRQLGSVPGAVDTAQVRVVRATLERTIPRAFAAGAGDDAESLAAAYARVFANDVDFSRDLRPGDELAVVYTHAADGSIVVEAASFGSQRHQATFEGYRWLAADAVRPAYFTAQGLSLTPALQNGPLLEYDEVLARPSDGPQIRGVEFAAAVGSPVVSPWQGTVARVDWNTDANGRSLEIQYADGLVAKFLHLSEVLVEAGAEVTAGEVIALTGDTGATTSPRLSYRLEREGAVVDPFEVHGAEPTTLPDDDRVAFGERASRLRAMLATGQMTN